MTRLGALAASIAVLLSGCDAVQGPVRIGVKSFDEQRILAAMIAEVVADQGLRSRIVRCGDTYGCQSALRKGEIDVMVEYSGTALALGGLPVSPQEAIVPRIRTLYEELGLRWLVPLGFRNDYAVVVPTARAASLGLKTIPDLAHFETGLRVVTDSAYAHRPGDGLYPLLRRYGLRLAEPPLLLEEPSARYEALFSGQADVTIAFTTDGMLEDRHLRILEDSAEFFPRYTAAIVASDSALDRFAGLEQALRRLEDRVDTAAMRQMNAEVQLQGLPPARAAADFLRRAGIEQTSLAEKAGRPELLLVHAATDRLADEIARALGVVRKVFSDHAVLQQSVADPVEALVQGNARLAVLGAERFFVRDSDGALDRDERIEAVSVLGNRLVHVLARQQATDANEPLEGRIGIVPEGSAAEVSEDILDRLNREPAVRAEPADLIERVANGTLDRALLLAEAPDPAMAEAFAADSGIALEALPAAQLGAVGLAELPYLRSSRVPPGTYAGQDTATETVAAQVVLAAPAETGRTHMGGPASALRTQGVPLLPGEARALREAGLAGEMPDPVLPSPWSLRSEPERQTPERAGGWVETMLNVVAWAFLGFLVVLLLRFLPKRSRQS